MTTSNEKTSPFKDINGLVADFLDDVADRPVPRGAKTRLDEIRQAVAQGKGTVQMALDIIEMFPNDKTVTHRIGQSVLIAHDPRSKGAAQILQDRASAIEAIPIGHDLA